MTFGPDGIFGHSDHITVGAADAAFVRLRSLGRQRAELGLFTFDPTTSYHMRGVPDARIGVTVDCRPVASRILAGLREHRSSCT